MITDTLVNNDDQENLKEYELNDVELASNLEDTETSTSGEEHQVSLLERLSQEYARKKFKSRIMALEILMNGIGKGSSLLHFGSQYASNILFNYFSDLISSGKIDTIDIKYTAVDPKDNLLQDLRSINQELFEKINHNSMKKSAQEFIDENRTMESEYDWTIVTGVFDKNNYGAEQFKFIDSILANGMNFAKNGIIFTFDGSKEKSKHYNIISILSYIESMYSRYKISKLDDDIYIICLYKYQYSLNN